MEKITSEIDGKKLYKIMVNNKSCNNGEFDWTDYLPNGTKKGKWTPKIQNISLCERGYHLAINVPQWYKPGGEIYEAEGMGECKVDEGDKSVFSSVRLIRKVTFNTGLANTGEFNSGNRNSGHWNSGDWNSGNRNIGDRNSGDWNIGDRNSGHWNSGNSNSGHRNSGHWNSGDRNSGHWNSGDSNSGHRNSGHWNSGDWNNGNRNSGHWNSGHWNSGNRHTGYFNTSKEPPFLMFDKPCKVKREDIAFPSYFYFVLTEWIDYPEEDQAKDEKKKAIGGYLKTYTYKEAWQKSFSTASIGDVAKTLTLPNFNYKKFEEITGITKKMLQNKLKERK